MSSTEALARRRAFRLASGDLCSESGCPNPRATRGLCKTHYNRATGNGWDGYAQDVEKRRASWRAKNHRRREASRASFDEVTPVRELELRRKAKRCPMPECGVKLLDAPYQPASKELDHIVPRNVGGTHTMGNVRIICRRCNEKRPKDGTDYIGAVTLWAQDHDVAGDRKERKRKCKQRPARLCQCGTEMTGSRCLTCRPFVVRVARGRPSYTPASEMTGQQQHARALRAADMRAQGRSWWEIADTLGYGRESSAMLAAQKVSAVATRPYQRSAPPTTGAWHRVPVVAKPMSCVDCGDPVVRGGRCTECWVEVKETMEVA